MWTRPWRDSLLAPRSKPSDPTHAVASVLPRSSTQGAPYLSSCRWVGGSPALSPCNMGRRAPGGSSRGGTLCRGRKSGTATSRGSYGRCRIRRGSQIGWSRSYRRPLLGPLLHPRGRMCGSGRARRPLDLRARPYIASESMKAECCEVVQALPRWVGARARRRALDLLQELGGNVCVAGGGGGPESEQRYTAVLRRLREVGPLTVALVEGSSPIPRGKGPVPVSAAQRGLGAFGRVHVAHSL